MGTLSYVVVDSLHQLFELGSTYESADRSLAEYSGVLVVEDELRPHVDNEAAESVQILV
jgi:hypothetical protein